MIKYNATIEFTENELRELVRQCIRDQYGIEINVARIQFYENDSLIPVSIKLSDEELKSIRKS